MGCAAGSLFIVVIFGIVSVFVVSTACFLTIKFAQNHKSDKLHHLLSYLGLAFCIISCMDLLATSITNPFFICNQEYRFIDFLRSFQAISSAIHVYLLWIILFIKIHFVFKNTVFRLKTCSIKCWIILFIFLFITYTTYFIGYFGIYVADDKDVDNFTQTEIIYIGSTVLLLWVFMTVIPIALSILFVSKLIKVNKSAQSKNQNKDDGLLAIITKITVLALLSIPSTMVLFYYYFYATTSPYRVYVRGWVYLLDTYSNFICILFSYKFFDRYYMLFCGSCHGICKRCCAKYNNVNETENRKDRVKSVSKNVTSIEMDQSEVVHSASEPEED